MWSKYARCRLHETDIPYGYIMLEWIRRGFDLEQCRQGLQRILDASGMPQSGIRFEGLDDGGLFVTDEVLYPKPRAQTLALSYPASDLEPPARANPSGQTFSMELMMELVSNLKRGIPWLSPHRGGSSAPMRKVDIQVDASNMRGLGDLFRGTDLKNAASLLGEHASKAVFQASADEPSWPEISEPGIYRREHASVVIRSRTTTILVDPITLWSGYPELVSAPTRRDGEHFDAIFITHTHADHWHPPSIMYWAGDSQVPVYVPQVPHRNVLSLDDPSAVLAGFGQKVIAPQWWSSLQVGDIVVDVLPFYGEQPTRDAPGAPPTLRNFGSCYRFNTPDFSVLVLVDSGADPAGSMVAAVRRSVAQRGPADVLLTSLPVFFSPFFLGLEVNFLTLPFYRLQELYAQFIERRLPSVTPGPKGIVEMCEEFQPRYYLTYGNGFAAPGVEIQDVCGDGQPSEAVLLSQISAELKAKKVETTAMHWSPGDRVDFRSGALRLHSYAELRSR
jgi:L-ascorbate metabolism protein UlaG (beta-lactamase superfamily)